MAELTTLARPYAKAAFEFARNAGEVAAWSSALETLSAILQNQKVETAMTSPALTATEKSEMLISLCDKLSEGVKNFIGILAENKRLLLLPQVFVLFQHYQAEYEKTLDVEIVSAYQLAGAAEKTLAKVLTARLQRDVKVQSRIDKSLLGGVVIHAGDTVIDGSARGQLRKLATAMNA